MIYVCASVSLNSPEMSLASFMCVFFVCVCACVFVCVRVRVCAVDVPLPPPQFSEPPPPLTQQGSS